MKKALAMLLLAAITLSLVGCGGEPDLYGIGLEVTQIMGEMADSKEYLQLFTTPGEIFSIAANLALQDFDDPKAVYRILPPKDEEDMVEALLGDDDLYEALSRPLKEQARNRCTVQTAVQYINSQANGPTQLAVTSLLNATVKEEALLLDEPVYYLYVFEDGVAVLVSFVHGAATGNFLLYPDLYTKSDVKELFSFFACSVKKLDIE